MNFRNENVNKELSEIPMRTEDRVDFKSILWIYNFAEGGDFGHQMGGVST